MNKRSEELLSKVHPELARRVRLIADRLAARGLPVEIGQGLRTIAEQNALFAQGRTRRGRIVTKVPGGKSPHNFGCAVDFLLAKPVSLVLPNGQVKLDGKKQPILTLFPDYSVVEGKVIEYPTWKAIAEEAKKVGLEAGYNWKGFQDKPHVEVPELDYGHGKVFTELYRNGGMARVWKEVDKILSERPVK
jgi:peptidoglycan L-alanyl-D-glutamate endopeptidase CwlK